MNLDLPDQLVTRLEGGAPVGSALEAVLKLHSRETRWVPVDHPMFVDGGVHVDLCKSCTNGSGGKENPTPYPCPTVMVIADELCVSTGLPKVAR